VVVLIRQFRLAAHLAAGLGELIEIVAGHVERGEVPQQAAARECVEEIGVEPRSLHPLFSFLPAPGLNDEYATMFLAIVDSTKVPERAGAEHEGGHAAAVRRYRCARSAAEASCTTDI
jgi:ADP-ribose pyrophosphatase